MLIRHIPGPLKEKFTKENPGKNYILNSGVFKITDLYYIYLPSTINSMFGLEKPSLTPR